MNPEYVQQNNHRYFALDSEPGEPPVSIFIRAWNHLRPGDDGVNNVTKPSGKLHVLRENGYGIFCVFQQTRRYGMVWVWV